MFRVCALFCPRIVSPLLYHDYLHVFPISCNCLAPPHFPESPKRMFIPQCTYSPHQSLAPCKFLLYTYFVLTLYLLSSLLISVIVLCLNIIIIPVSCSLFRSSLFLMSLPMSSKSCIFIFHRSMSVCLFSFDFVAPPPSVCFTLCIVYVRSSCCIYRDIDFLVLTLSSCSRPLSVYFDICDYLDSDLVS